MKTKIIISALTIFALLSVYATSDDKIVVYSVNGEEVVYSTSEINEITFSDDKMTILKSTGQEIQYDVTTSTKVTRDVEAVDLGLSVKWASMNIGAQKPSDYGDYFAWGETEPKNSYDPENSKWYKISSSSLQSRGVIDTNGNLTSKYDAATVKWGAPWRMPTYTEIKELLDKCRWTWTSLDGHMGYNVTGPNGNSIFLPAAGYCIYGIDGTSVGSSGYYWSATAYGDGSDAYDLYFHSSGRYLNISSRDAGRSVRPVAE